MRPSIFFVLSSLIFSYAWLQCFVAARCEGVRYSRSSVLDPCRSGEVPVPGQRATFSNATTLDARVFVKNVMERSCILENAYSRHEHMYPRPQRPFLDEGCRAEYYQTNDKRRIANASSHGLSWPVRIKLAGALSTRELVTDTVAYYMSEVEDKRLLLMLILAYLSRHTRLKHDFGALLMKLTSAIVPPYTSRDTRRCKPYVTRGPSKRCSLKANGGGRPLLTSDVVSPFLLEGGGSLAVGVPLETLGFVSDRPGVEAYSSPAGIWGVVLMDVILPFCMKYHLLSLTKLHDMTVPGSQRTVAKLTEMLLAHRCTRCPVVRTTLRVKAPVGKPAGKNGRVSKAREMERVKHLSDTDSNIRSLERSMLAHEFPPPPPSAQLQDTICADYCQALDPVNWEEGACMVCGELKPKSQLTHIDQCPSLDLDLLKRDGVTRMQREHDSDDICEMTSPVVLSVSNRVCTSCEAALSSSRVPRFALANGLWLGEVPDALKNLSFAEKLLVARVRHNSCVVRVASGRVKMAANAVLFQNPTIKIYHKLPPSRKELSEVLAIIFIGENQPTREDYEQTPLLVRRNVVAEALRWLKLNHVDYHDLIISHDNLETYPLSGVPVLVDYRKSVGEGNREVLASSLHDNDAEEGTSSGPCSFAVSGLTGNEYGTMSIEALRAKALNHLTGQGKVLVVGRSSKPESLYDNPQLYPQMFPWLFPYGLGGLGNERLAEGLSESVHKRHLLMYHDKRFQIDPFFPMLAFNHEQIKSATTASFVLARRQSFEQIVDRIKALDSSVLHRLADRMKDGQRVVPDNAEEQACFDVISDVDQIGGHVQGSITSKKSMRNEIWSLMSFVGAPSWFITFSPADVMSPLCIYFAQTDEEFSPTLLSKELRDRAIALNPVAAARFFHYVCQTFISCVLGVGLDRPGLYGETSAYYGVVEQQGRLTLHMHMLLWIRGNLSPQIIRERLAERGGEFERRLIQYLEGCHQGDFMEGTLEDVRARVPMAKTAYKRAAATTIPKAFLPLEKEGYDAPTETLPEGPPSTTCNVCGYCQSCEPVARWREKMRATTDDILLRSNVHSCYASNKGGEVSNKRTVKGCMKANGVCSARFPRDIVERTIVTADGHIVMKKREPLLNTFTPLVTYLLRGNTDVTSLLSGTAVKAVVMYVTDYITKQGLKTYQIFDAVAEVLRRLDATSSSKATEDSKDPARRLLLRVVNNLTSKSEIGSPMASMYLLGQPDHYTSHRFVKLWWRNYVAVGWKHFCTEDTSPADDNMGEETVRIGKVDEAYVSISTTDDYMHRPKELAHLNVYEWTQTCERVSVSATGDSDQDREENDMNNDCVLESDDTTAFRRRASSRTGWSFSEYLSSAGGFDETRPYTGAPLRSKAHCLRFMPGHPLRKTHMIKYHPWRRNWVPDFKGGQLPRSDQGNREYYCATMLTLFKPWYLKEDLKRASQTWEEAFREYVFTGRQLQVLANFDLRYKCLDERDDFHAQTIALGNRVNDGEEGDIDHGQYDVEVAGCEGVEVECPDKLGTFLEMNSTAREHQRKMDEISSTMANAGWLRPEPTTLEDCATDFTRQSVSRWTSCIKMLRERVLNAKIADSSVTSSGVERDSTGLVAVMDAESLGTLDRGRWCWQRRVLESVCLEFQLNPEQNRVFRMVAEHAIRDGPPQLKMYLGGMAGTGKSRVLKALTEFLSRLGESHRIVILGPTGSCAALIGGSTYHSVLGFTGVENDSSSAQSRSVSQVRSRLQGVDYIFLDEISMVSCRDLYRISGRLAEARHVSDVPFGGMNMILAGDFAQLPPVGGHPLYDAFVGPLSARSSRAEQESRIGRALWLQFVSVVMLKSNMRQRSQSKDDESLRIALTNMRYCDCTEQDVAFLRSLVSTNERPNRNLGDPSFRNASVITAWNLQKDRINKLGTIRFAADTGQSLHVFRSLDVLAEDESKKKRRNGGHKTNLHLTSSLRAALWQTEHSESEHVAGTLSLCKGLPVVLRHNYATELCMTKGQDATVVDWDYSTTQDGDHVLDTLYVLLQDPPREVRVPGLPSNVVPLVRCTVTVRCLLPNGLVVSVKRSQIPVLPNFAMTDYASQGKTRTVNVVDLQNCKNHLAVYTCLSRSADASHTIVVQGFDAKKICGGRTVKFLRAELRELEALDEVGKVMENLPCRQRDTFRTREDVLEWRKNNARVRPPISKRSSSSVEGEMTSAKQHKKRERSSYAGPLGLEWDSKNFSCAYDAVLTIRLNVWRSDKTVFESMSGRYVKQLRAGFEKLSNGTDFRDLRDLLRDRLHREDPALFPYGKVGIAVSDLYYALFTPIEAWAEGIYHCRVCGTSNASIAARWLSVSTLVADSDSPSVRHWLSARFATERRKCSRCWERTGMSMALRFKPERLGLAGFALAGDNWRCEAQIDFVAGDRAVLLDLKGVVFWHASHFTAVVVDDTKTAWFHDGMTTKTTCNALGPVSDVTPEQKGVVGVPMLQ